MVDSEVKETVVLTLVQSVSLMKSGGKWTAKVAVVVETDGESSTRTAVFDGDDRGEVQQAAINWMTRQS